MGGKWVRWTPVQLSAELEELLEMPIVVVATMTAKPESVDAVRDACKQAMETVHSEPGC